MARVLYGVAGEGFGHSSRCHLTAKKLEQAGHSVLFAASNKSLIYLSKHFPGRVSQVHGLTFSYKDARVSLGRTFLSNMASVPDMIKVNRKAFKSIYPGFAPDVVITDFEPFSALWARLNGVPCLSVDHEHLLCKCRYEMPKTKLFARLSSQSVTKNYLVGVNSHIILNFFQVDAVSGNARIVNPVVRDIALEYKPSDEGDFIVFYATSQTCLQQFLDLAKHFPKQKFHLYGFAKQPASSNCIFKEHSTEGFVYDLSRCRGVVATGGFSLISECLHFRKKMFVKPIDMQVEQMINAYHLAKMGAGMYINNFSTASLQTFLDWLQEPYSIDRSLAIMPDNNRYFAVLSDCLEQLTNGKVSLKSVLYDAPQINKELVRV